MTSRRILTFQPLVFTPGDERFLVTNLGALVVALNQLGHTAGQVALRSSSSASAERIVEGVLTCSREEASSAAWWLKQNPWAVISNTWGAPRFDPIRKAILETTPRLIDRLDSDGNRSPRTDLPIYVHAMWSRLRDMQNKPAHRLLSPLIPFGHAATHLAFPGILDRRQAEVLSQIPIVTAESPIAAERIVRFQRDFGFSGANICVSPFPVNEANLDVSLRSSTKLNRIVSVGRWAAHQKNFPMMLQVLGTFLRSTPDWDAILPGSRPDNWKKLLKRYCSGVENRISIPGPLPHAKIYEEFGNSKIFLMTSRHESFGIAAAEALCLGCSVVGPAHIPSVPWFCGSDSGSVATIYTNNGLLDALAAEVRSWTSGGRNPETIANIWRGRVSASNVGRDLVNMLENLTC